MMSDFEIIQRKPYNLIIEILKEHPDKRIRLKHLSFAVCYENKDLPFEKQVKKIKFFDNHYLDNTWNIQDKKEYQKYVINLFWLAKKNIAITGNRQYNNLNNCLTRLEKRKLIDKLHDKSHSPYFVLTDRVKYCIEYNRFNENSKHILDVKNIYPDRLKPMHIQIIKEWNEGIEKILFS